MQLMQPNNKAKQGLNLRGLFFPIRILEKRDKTHNVCILCTKYRNFTKIKSKVQVYDLFRRSETFGIHDDKYQQ